MSQQSNPATLREALTKAIRSTLVCKAGCRKSDSRECASYQRLVEDSCDCDCHETWTALAASGTEAAPNKAMLALESLTPGGSEYVGDIKRCVETVLETRRSQMEQIVKLTKRVHELEAAASTEAAHPPEYYDDVLKGAPDPGGKSYYRQPAQAAASPEGEGRDMPWTPEVEVFRAEMMRRFSNKLSMEEVANFSYWVALRQSAAPSGVDMREAWFEYLRSLAQESKTGAVTETP